MTSGRGRTVNYSTFDKPTKITQGGNTVWFSYGPEVNRYKRVEHNGTDVTTTYYVGNVEFIEKNGIQTIKRMIGGVVEVSELFNSKGESILDYTYLFKDHLGSVVATTNHKGQNTQQLAFDAWGQRRPANWSTPSYYDGYAMGLTGITNSLLMPLPVNTGFTGHEHVDSVGLIHMNGRIYDPVLGRFLSADPFIQYPSVVQNLNRYSYLMNNPLNATDPTGYFVDKIVQQGFVQAVTTVALTAIHPALGAAYVAYNAAGSAKSMMQAAQVWQGGGDLPWGDMLVNSLFSQAIGGMMGMIGGGIVESNRQARIAAELEALLGKIETDLGNTPKDGHGKESRKEGNVVISPATKPEPLPRELIRTTQLKRDSFKLFLVAMHDRHPKSTPGHVFVGFVSDTGETFAYGFYPDMVRFTWRQMVVENHMNSGIVIDDTAKFKEALTGNAHYRMKEFNVSKSDFYKAQSYIFNSDESPRIL